MALAVLLPLCALLALGSIHGCTRGAALIELNESTAGQPASLHVGEQLRISLSENTTTGYSWRLGSSCASLLKLDDDEAAPPSSAALGAPHLRTWRFTALSGGQCDLRFESVRPWEKTATGKVLTFPVDIHQRSNSTERSESSTDPTPAAHSSGRHTAS